MTPAIYLTKAFDIIMDIIIVICTIIPYNVPNFLNKNKKVGALIFVAFTLCLKILADL